MARLSRKGNHDRMFCRSLSLPHQPSHVKEVESDFSILLRVKCRSSVNTFLEFDVVI